MQHYDDLLWSRSIEDNDWRERKPPPSLTTDIQAILTVLGRRTRSYGKEEDQSLDLSVTDLNAADLHKANLVGAFLSGTNLRGADLRGADLRNAHLVDAYLFFAFLGGAQLHGADLRGAVLHVAHDLTVEQLSTVASLYQVELDPYLLAQIQQQYPHLLEKPQDSLEGP